LAASGSPEYDFLVVGSGIAGSFAALHAARHGSVLLLTRTALAESNSFYAQGGIAAAMGESDSVESHIADTVEVGRGLCDPEAVRVLVSEGPERIRELIQIGVRFDREGDQLALGREAAHSAARIVHAGGDTTGAEIQRGLHQALKDAAVQTVEGHTVQQLNVPRRTAAPPRWATMPAPSWSTWSSSSSIPRRCARRVPRAS